MLDEQCLVDMFEKFVWSKQFKKIGRPVQSKEKYLRDCEAKIAKFKAELALLKRKEEISKMKNKIAA